MVGLLIVSHSALIADGVKELAEQMTGGKVPMQRPTVVGHEDGVWSLRNWEGKTYRYVDPAER